MDTTNALLRNTEISRRNRTSIWFPIIALLLLANVAFSGYRWLEARQRHALATEAVAAQALSRSALLIAGQSDYEKAVYENPNVKGVAQQQFRATEFSNEYLRIIIQQNDEIMRLLAAGY